MAKKKRGPRFYGVRVGRTPGVYDTWQQCEAETSGYSGAEHKAFGTESEAAEWVAAGSSSSSNATPMTTRRYYAVAVGRAPGVYTDHADALASCAGFRRAKYQGFEARSDAEAYVHLFSRRGSSGGGAGASLVDDEDRKQELYVGEDEEEREEREERKEEDDDDNDDDSADSASSWGNETIKVEDIAPRPFMLSVYESTQREQQQASLIDLTGDSDDGHAPSSSQFAAAQHAEYAPSSAQQQQPPPSSYFDQFHDFKPEPTASFDDEFARCMSSQAIAPRTAEYRLQRTRAIAQEINFHYSSQPRQANDNDNDGDNNDESSNDPPTTLSQFERERAHRLEMYQNLCRATRLPIHATLKGCEDALQKVLVNIVDYIDVARAHACASSPDQNQGPGPCVEVWDDFDAFRNYTLGGDGSKCIDRQEAKRIDGGFLTVLLRDFRGGGGRRRKMGKRKREREREGEGEGRRKRGREGEGVVTGAKNVKCARVS